MYICIRIYIHIYVAIDRAFNSIAGGGLRCARTHPTTAVFTSIRTYVSARGILFFENFGAKLGAPCLPAWRRVPPEIMSRRIQMPSQIASYFQCLLSSILEASWFEFVRLWDSNWRLSWPPHGSSGFLLANLPKLRKPISCSIICGYVSRSSNFEAQFCKRLVKM